MIYHRKAETVRAIQITDCSPEMVEKVKVFAKCGDVNCRTHSRWNRPMIAVFLFGRPGRTFLELFQGEWLVRSRIDGWQKYQDYDFKRRFEEGEHGQQSGDGAAEGL